jgi:UDP-glucose 4-epimerase
VEQILRGGPLTITNPRMTRFLLPLQSAIDLVLYALEHAGPGEVFIRKSPACTVEVLAAALGRLLDREVERRVIGIRHGEKLFETLATREEMTRAENQGEFLRIRMDDRDLNYGKYFTEGNLEESELEDYTSHNTTRLGLEQVEELLRSLPELHATLGEVRAGAG